MPRKTVCSCGAVQSVDDALVGVQMTCTVCNCQFTARDAGPVEPAVAFDWSKVASPSTRFPTAPHPPGLGFGFGSGGVSVRVPNRCACCGRQSADRKKTMTASTQGLFDETITTYTIELPVCAACLETTERRRRIVNRVGLALAFLAVAVVYVLLRIEAGPTARSIMAAFVGLSVMSLALVFWVWLLARMAANVDFARFRGNGTLFFTNTSYQREFDTLNKGSALGGGRRGMSEFLWAMPVAISAGACALFPSLVLMDWIESQVRVIAGDNFTLAQGVSEGLVFGAFPALVAVGFTWAGRRPVSWGKLLLCFSLGIATACAVSAWARTTNPTWLPRDHHLGIGMVIVIAAAVASVVLTAWILRAKPANSHGG